MSDHFDLSEVNALAAKLATMPAKVIPALVPVASKAGVNVKRVMAKDASGHSHLPGLARAVAYDVTQTASSVTVEIGFRRQGQGNFANIAAFGTGHNPPVMDVTRGLRAEGPKFAAFVAKVGTEALK